MTFAIALFGLLSATSYAGESGKAPNEAPKTAAEAKASQSDVQMLAFVAQLVHWSREAQSPDGLVTAAQVIASMPVREYEAQKVAEPIKGLTADRDKEEETALTLDPKALLKEALWYASATQDKKQIAYLDALARRGIADQRGAEGGPKYAVTRAQAAMTDVYEITFTGGELAEISVAGDGDTDLDLYIYDEFNNYIGSDTGVSDGCYVSWTPRWTGKFRIEVRNNGLVHNQYVFITN